MSHPRTWSDTEPFLPELRAICLALPEATEVEAWGRPTFRAGKIFAMSTLGPAESYSVVFKPDPEDDAALRGDERFFVPRYWGPSGWLGLDFGKAAVDWEEVAELVEGSYRQVALKRMIKALDARAGGG